MVEEVMTVHKGLSELKILTDRIERAVSEGIFCKSVKHSAAKIDGVERDEYVKVIQGNYDSAVNLIRRQKAIKRAIDLSNAITHVDVCGTDYTVAEAIWMKNVGTKYDQLFLDELRRQHSANVGRINTANDELQEKADMYVEAVYGDNESKKSAADVNKIREDFITSNSYELVDPIKILDKINDMEKSISEFTAEIDSALSVSNALTKITVRY